MKFESFVYYFVFVLCYKELYRNALKVYETETPFIDELKTFS